MNEPNSILQKTATKRDVAAFLGVTTRTVENLMKNGLLPFWKLNRTCRFDLDAVKKALDERCGHNRSTN
jgi:excisionase family DNA binding protein